MELVNLKDASDKASFAEAVKKGLGKNQGLFFPTNLAKFDDIDAILALPFVERSVEILTKLIGDELPKATIAGIVERAFAFPAPLTKVTDNIYSLELYHGPTLAFKDFGGRFMAQCLAEIAKGEKITILTATSGDTGAAVAHAFHGMDNIDVVILFPKGKISLLQEKLFTTLGDNIHTVAIDADFDACQQLVKSAFDDQEVRVGLHLNSANSINISRLVAQVCYYFEAVAQLSSKEREDLVISVPSGNFGNLTAGMIAKVMGLPIKHFIAATNLNDTVPRYLKTGEWAPKATIATLSNAMDVSQPNNWPRIEAIIEQGYLDKSVLSGDTIDEEYTQVAMRQLAQLGYVSEPHAAIAYKALVRQLEPGQTGIFLGTAHPAKFRETVENVLGQPISLPQALAECASKEAYSVDLPNDYAALKAHLFSLLG
ncbi:threonine synthase [Paraglaciecola hydrolytica]|uniref:Threonine synthase n=1 Tax=Paraglaciecola hydrolytica TaxID=1799789 RepID=A0A136A2X1_9ALTE|nr:threonine synthase [Paraglaciecola hydrolytica]KXI29572.1 threonine synthase [Paraglaciecola hydrolytica]